MAGLLSLVDNCHVLASHVRARFDESIDDLIDQGVAGGLLDAERARVARGHRGGPLPARALQYFDLGLRLMQDDAARAGMALDDLGRGAAWDHGVCVQPYDAELFGRDFERLAALMFGNRVETLQLGSPTPDTLAHIRSQHDEVVSVMAELAPELGEEFELLVDVVVLAEPATPARDSYGSATTLAAIGLILVNPVAALGFLDHLGTYVHELTHMVLHALTGDERLSLNDEADRFSSPLRSDPRPMEGVVHATIVCARMAAAYQRLAANDNVGSGESAQQAHDLLTRFEDGASLIDHHAVLSPLGQDVWQRTHELVRAELPWSSTAHR